MPQFRTSLLHQSSILISPFCKKALDLWVSFAKKALGPSIKGLLKDEPVFKDLLLCVFSAKEP